MKKSYKLMWSFKMFKIIFKFYKIKENMNNLHREPLNIKLQKIFLSNFFYPLIRIRLNVKTNFFFWKNAVQYDNQ